ncbi:hypothetical protein ACFL0T_06175 [Candidatus Omnitrophota bacterium]
MLKKILISIFVIIALAFITIAAAISFGKTIIPRSFIERTIKGTMDLRFSIGDCIVSVLNADVRVKDLVVLNPKSFQDKIMFDIREIYADFDVPSLFKRRAIFKDLRINIDDIFIIKSRDGTLNLESLTVVKASKQGEEASDISGGAKPEMRVENFEFKVKRVVYKDYSQAILPMIIEKEVNINERFENINDPALIIRIVLVEAIKKAALEQILPISIQAMSKPLLGIIEAGKGIGKGTISVMQQTGKQITEATKLVTGAKKKIELIDTVDIGKATQASLENSAKQSTPDKITNTTKQTIAESISQTSVDSINDKQAKVVSVIKEK